MNGVVLIVDDVRLNIDVLTDILCDKYQIMAAVSGEGAIRIMERKKPDLVLLDLSMPGIDGFGVLEHMKNDESLANIPVIFVTSEHDSDFEEKGLSMGAMDYIKKPYNSTIVKIKVRNQLELKSYRDSLEELVRERTKELEQRTEELASSREAIIMGMSLMSESRDTVTGHHIMRIKEYTEVLTEKMMEMYPGMLTKELAARTVLFSTMHDIGKVSTPDHVLKKAGMLTKEEFDEMKRHTTDGAELLRKTKSFLADDGDDLQVAISIAEFHHEKFNGCGYFGLKGEEIPLPARIVAVADVYDALRSIRPYKQAFSHKEAMKILLTGDGRTNPEDFDPRILEVFQAVQKKFKKIFA